MVRNGCNMCHVPKTAIIPPEWARKADFLRYFFFHPFYPQYSTLIPYPIHGFRNKYVQYNCKDYFLVQMSLFLTIGTASKKYFFANWTDITTNTVTLLKLSKCTMRTHVNVNIFADTALSMLSFNWQNTYCFKIFFNEWQIFNRFWDLKVKIFW